MQSNSDGLPRLDAYLAAQVTDPKHLKGEFGVTAQSFVERAHALGALPSGRALLAMLSKRFRVDRIRGATVSQQTFLAIQLEGFSQQHLQTFRERVEFCLNGFSSDAWPAENTMFSWSRPQVPSAALPVRGPPAAGPAVQLFRLQQVPVPPRYPAV